MIKDDQDVQKKKDRLNLLENKLHPQLIRDWKAYKDLSSKQKDMLMDDWDQYFIRLREGKAYRRFKKMRQVFESYIANPTDKKQNLLKQFSLKARQQLEASEWETAKPSLQDPQYMMNHQAVAEYESLTSEINKLSGITEDFQGLGL